MNPNKLQKQLQRYFRQINRQLPCPRQERKRFLASLKENVAAYLKEQPQCTIEDIWAQFGTVTDMVETYASAENTALFIKKRKRLLIAVVTLVICLVMCGTFFIYFIHQARNTQVTHINIYTEIEE